MPVRVCRPSLQVLLLLPWSGRTQGKRKTKGAPLFSPWSRFNPWPYVGIKTPGLLWSCFYYDLNESSLQKGIHLSRRHSCLVTQAPLQTVASLQLPRDQGGVWLKQGLLSSYPEAGPGVQQCTSQAPCSQQMGEERDNQISRHLY